MSEMVERVAIAIQNGSALEVGGKPLLSIETCRLIARTAIEAMHEPTKEMIDAACEITGYPLRGDHPVNAWRVMIDAALK